MLGFKTGINTDSKAASYATHTGGCEKLTFISDLAEINRVCCQFCCILEQNNVSLTLLDFIQRYTEM